MSHGRSGEIANIDGLDPGQEYYIIGAHWGAALPASKAGDKVDMTTGHGGAWNPGQSGGEKWTIQRADGGYNIKSVEHGSYLGFHHTEIDNAQNASSGLTASKEPFAWTVEPQDKGDGVFRFTVPHTEVHVDFSSVASVTSGASPSVAAGSANPSETTEADLARETAAAGHNFDPNFTAAGGGNAGRSAGGGTAGRNAGGGSDVEPGSTAEEDSGPTLHAFGRPYGFPPGYFGK